MFFNRYLEGRGAINSRAYATLDDVSYPSIEELAGLVDTHAKKYPDTDAMEAKDIEMIKEHFPNLSDREIAKNLDKIAAYYDKNLQFDVIKALEKNGLKHPTNSRAQYVGELCNDEFWVVFGRLKAANAVRDATNDARAYTKELYGGSDSGGDQADAFRHCIWNVLIAKYYAEKKRDINKGLKLAQDFTNAHESCSRDDGVPAYDIEMDLHNNLAGRNYYNSNARARKRRGLFRRDEIISPSNGVIKQAIKSRADRATKVNADVASVKRVAIRTLVYFF